MTPTTYHILLTEDSVDAQQAYSRLLSSWGYECTVAGSCAEAREIFKPGKFACALIDLGLPDGHGLDLIVDFAQKDIHLVNIVLSGDGSPESIIKTMREGVFDYVTKPFQTGILRQVVHRALTHHEAIRQRSNLTQLLLNERQQLRIKVDEATRDLREYATSCEISNARLSALVRLTQASSSGLQMAEDLFQEVLREISTFMSIVGIALIDGPDGDFLAAHWTEDKQTVVIAAEGSPLHETQANNIKPDAEQDVWNAVEKHTSLNAGNLSIMTCSQVLGNRPTCSVGFLFPGGEVPGPEEREFLEMCAYHLAAEWEMNQLLQYAAHYAGLGNIALESSKAIIRSITAIQLAVDVLEEILDSEEAKAGLAIIPENLSLLREQIVEFRSIANQREDAVETVSLEALIEQSLVLLHDTLKSYKVDIVREFNVDSQCVLLNGTALQRTFFEMLSVVVRCLAGEGRIMLRLSDESKRFIRFDIIPEKAVAGQTDNYPNELIQLLDLKKRPDFLLAQRTIHTCAGRISIETDAGGQVILSIILPRDATRGHIMVGGRA